MKLQDKNTIVTGGASGFGAGIVARFLEEGANVTIVDFDETAALAYMESLSRTVFILSMQIWRTVKVLQSFLIVCRLVGRDLMCSSTTPVQHIFPPY